MTTVPEPINETVGDLLATGDYDEALGLLEAKRNEIGTIEYETQRNRIHTIRSYSEFYSKNDSESRKKMVSDAKSAVDNYFGIVSSTTVGNSDKSMALNTVAFLYSETWSDSDLLQYIAGKLGIQNFDAQQNIQKASVFSELFSRSIEYFPTQDAYIKRAWFNSRLLLTDATIVGETRNQIVQSIKDDVATSNAEAGMRFTTKSRYYNSYIALAFADVLDFLHQEKMLPDYSSVDTAYTQALSLASSDFFGSLIIQDIVRMNYAASLYRSDTEGAQGETIAGLLQPVANHIKQYSASPAIAYEGILVMLRDVPRIQNQNNAAIYDIFRNFAEFNEVPSLLGWSQEGEENLNRYIFKLI